MAIKDWLQAAIKKLESASVPTARLDAEVLLANYLGKDRSWIHANLDYLLNESALEKLDNQIKRRTKHEPLAYIRGNQEFYGRNFIVTTDTLTPRPETETMIVLLLEAIEEEKLLVDRPLQIVDIGTGSGCIIISIALELAKLSNTKDQSSYLGLDISEKALKIAGQNAATLDAKVKFHTHDLLKDTMSSYTNHQKTNIILANLPYVPDDYPVNMAVTYEPKIALYSGKDGLNHYRKLFSELSNHAKNEPRQPAYILTESLLEQHDPLEKLATEAGYSLHKAKDLIQVFARN